MSDQTPGPDSPESRPPDHRAEHTGHEPGPSQPKREGAERPASSEASEEEDAARRARLFEEAHREANRYKWIVSEQAGRDLGEGAVHEWHRNYWRSWCRERWIEHLRGVRFWEELDQEDYGLLKRQFHDNLELAEKIVDRIRQGGENLDIIQWAREEHYSVDDVLKVLKILDINSRRLAPPVHYSTEEPRPAGQDKDTATRTARALVVDDDEDTRLLVKEVFESEGVECIPAADGEGALRMIEKYRFQCYLIDIMLPGKHGAEVAWYLRRHRISVPVIAITAALNRWTEDDLYDCGFTGVMPKPFDLAELRDLAKEVRTGRVTHPVP